MGKVKKVELFVCMALVSAILLFLVMWGKTDMMFAGKGTMVAQRGEVGNETVDTIIDMEETIAEDDNQEALAGEDCFVQYRLARELVRQEEKALLQELLASDIEKTKEAAQEKWLEMTTKTTRENELEYVLKMNGFLDAVANIHQNGINVYVLASSVTSEETALIRTLVRRTVEVSSENISIVIKRVS